MKEKLREIFHYIIAWQQKLCPNCGYKMILTDKPKYHTPVGRFYEVTATCPHCRRSETTIYKY